MVLSDVNCVYTFRSCLIILFRNIEWDPKFRFLIGSHYSAKGTFHPDIIVQPPSTAFDFFGNHDLFVKFLSEHKKAGSLTDDRYAFGCAFQTTSCSYHCTVPLCVLATGPSLLLKQVSPGSWSICTGSVLVHPLQLITGFIRRTLARTAVASSL